MPKEKKDKLNKDSEVIPPPPDKPQQCHFWVGRKRRYCHLPAKRENKYCGEHMTEFNKTNDNTQSRIPCPFDPAHTVDIRDLENHKKKCNRRPSEPKPYYSLNMNITLPLSEEELVFQQNIHSHKKLKAMPWLEKIRLDSLERTELDQLIHKVQSAYDQYVTLPIDTQILSFPTLKIDDSLTKKAARHLYQQSSLLGHMRDCGMLKDKNACFIEFGAGRGELSGHLKDALQEENGESTFVLIDRKNVKHKFDSYLLGKSKKLSTVRRILIDIKDLNLEKLDVLMNEQGEKKKVVTLSKHLCGCATDITLKCLMNYVEKEKSNGNSQPISGIVIALCCHQLCRYEMYPNNSFIEKVGLSKLEFNQVCKMSSWAVCGQRNTDSNSSNGDSDHEQVLEEDETGGHYSGRQHEEREKIGYQCKRLLDAGRIDYLQQYGFKAYLVYYVEPESTLENCALIAIPQ
ncbi:unnamed protein product [Cunninghamella blakesleeana]